MKQSISNTILRFTSCLKRSFIVTAVLVSLSFPSIGFSKETTTYGPTKKGESLWLVAKKLNNKSVSIQQLTLAIYQLNPNSFASGNMNLLKAGTILNIPNNETITQTSSKAAIKKLRQQEHQLKLFHISASQLKSAKNNVKKQKSKIKKFQKKLGKYKHKSRQWNKTYRQLVSSKRSHNKAKRKVVDLRKLLREKTQLQNQQELAKKITPTPKISKKERVTADSAMAGIPIVAATKDKPTTKKTKIDKVDKRLGSIQDSLKVIGKSNTQLMTKIIELSSLNKRVQVLEKELGNNNKLVMDLKQSLETAQAMMKQQSQNNANLLQSFEKFEVTLNKPKPAVIVINTENTNKAETVTSTIKESVEDPIVASSNKEAEPVAKTDIREQLMTQLLSETKQAPVDEIKDVDVSQTVNQSQIIVEAAEVVKEETTDVIVDTELLAMNLSETKQFESTDNVIKEAPVEAKVVEANTVVPEEELQVVANVNETKKALTVINSYDTYSKSDITETPQLISPKGTAQAVTYNETVKATMNGFSSEKTSMLPTKPSDVAISHQRKLNRTFNKSENYWVSFLKERWIAIMSALNALILLFVLFKLFKKRKNKLTYSISDNDDYISWQDREKPRHA